MCENCGITGPKDCAVCRAHADHRPPIATASRVVRFEASDPDKYADRVFAVLLLTGCGLLGLGIVLLAALRG